MKIYISAVEKKKHKRLTHLHTQTKKKKWINKNKKKKTHCPVRWLKAVGSASGGSTALSTETLLPPQVGGWRGQGIARVFTYSM